jgi:hypothetical protein
MSPTRGFRAAVDLETGYDWGAGFATLTVKGRIAIKFAEK